MYEKIKNDKPIFHSWTRLQIEEYDYLIVLLDTTLPILADFFRQFIPNEFSPDVETSILSNLIVGIVDGTIHKIRKPQANQAIDYNGNYRRHGSFSKYRFFSI